MTEAGSPDWRTGVAGLSHPSVAEASLDDEGVIAKRVSYPEVVAHQAVAARVPLATPPVLASWPVDGGSAWMLVTPKMGASIADSTAPNQSTADVRSGVRDGLRLLAEVHAAFREVAGPVPHGEGAGIDRLDRTGTLLSRRNEDWSLELDAVDLLRWDALEEGLPAFAGAIGDPQRWTLVHGDFHAGNLIRDDAGRVRIIDWGSASRQVPAWDLVTFDDDLIAEYGIEWSRVTGSAVDMRFGEELRAATVVRLHRLVADILGGTANGLLDGSLRARAIRQCVIKALVAGESTAAR